MRDLDALVLDVGNTLYYFDYDLVLRVLSEHGLPGLPLELARRAEARARPRLSDDLAMRRASTEAAGSFRRYLGFALEEADVVADEARVDLAFADLCRRNRRRNVFDVPAPGALPALVRLREAGLVLAVVSNSNGTVARKLERDGFAPLFSTIVDSGLIGIEKPDPRIFLAACERAGVRPARSLYVGDLYSVDALGARGAGLLAALVDPAGAYAERGVDVETVRDVAELAERLLAE